MCAALPVQLRSRRSAIRRLQWLECKTIGLQLEILFIKILLSFSYHLEHLELCLSLKTILQISMRICARNTIALMQL